MPTRPPQGPEVYEALARVWAEEEVVKADVRFDSFDFCHQWGWVVVGLMRTIAAEYAERTQRSFEDLLWELCSEIQDDLAHDPMGVAHLYLNEARAGRNTGDGDQRDRFSQS
jgi:lipoprotein NlpI